MAVFKATAQLYGNGKVIWKKKVFLSHPTDHLVSDCLIEIRYGAGYLTSGI